MYRIIGADGREYGPVTDSQLRQWIAEGRANAQTPALAPGAPEWKPLGSLPEFAGQFAPPAPPVIGTWPGTAKGVRIRKTSGFAVTGLICAVLAWMSYCCCCGFPLNLLGLIFSLIGWSQVSRQPELYAGRGLAVAGLILSAASLLLGFGMFLFQMAFHPGNLEWHFRQF
jgi:hypothetical protein